MDIHVCMIYDQLAVFCGESRLHSGPILAMHSLLQDLVSSCVSSSSFFAHPTMQFPVGAMPIQAHYCNTPRSNTPAFQQHGQVPSMGKSGSTKVPRSVSSKNVRPNMSSGRYVCLTRPSR